MNVNIHSHLCDHSFFDGYLYNLESHVQNYQSHHTMSLKNIILNVKTKEDKKVLKFSKKFLMLWLLRWGIKSNLLVLFSRESWKSSGKTHTVSKFLTFLLKIFKSGSYALSIRIPFDSFRMLHFKVL